MKTIFYGLLITILASTGFTNNKKTALPVSGALGNVMKSLDITASEVEENRVLLVTTDLKNIKKNPKLSKVTIFLLYLSAAKTAPKEGVIAFFDYDRFKLVDNKTLMGSQKFLTEAIVKHAEIRVQNLALITLAMVFPGDLEVFSILQNNYYFSRASDVKKSAILKALGLGKFHAPLIIRSALHSTNLSLIINAAAAVKSNQHLYPDLLPDLVSALLKVNTRRKDYQSTYSFLCRTITMYKYKSNYLNIFKKLNKNVNNQHLKKLILASK